MFILVSILLFILIMVSIVILFSRIRKLQKSNVILELESEVNDLVLELNQTADRNINILEEKIKALTSLLHGADKRIKILGTESEKIKSEPVTYNQLGLVNGANNTSDNAFSQEHKQDLSKQTVETNNKDIIIELHNNGFTSPVIATRVGLTVGEVELIISLVEGR
ncbi:MAG: hypothetical protein KAH95_16650 [Spirochaetales bacterium]|nr:hypothetical protein [Spirochaetales bacterium]